MTNEEMQRVLEFTMQRQETFAEGMDQLKERQNTFQTQLERMGANLERLEANQAQLQAEMSDMARTVAQLGNAQEQTQRDIPNLTKIVGPLIDFVTKDRDGGAE